MWKNKTLFYLVFSLSIFVIIGFILIISKDFTPKPNDKSIIDEISPIRNTSLDKETPQTQSLTFSSREISKDGIQNTKNTPEMDSGITLSGSVILSDGSPAGKAKIKLTRIDISESFFDEIPISSTTADITGKYSIIAPNIRFILVRASYPGYASMATIKGNFLARGERSSPEETKELVTNFILPPASYIKGCVVDENDNTIQGITVSSSSGRAKIMETFSYEKAVTDNQGRFEIQNILSGKTALTAASLDRKPQVKEINAPAENIIFQLLPATGSISGRVLHKATGEAIPNTLVRIGFINQRQITNMPQKQSITDRTGFFSFDHLAPGQYYIKAQKDDLLLFASDDLPNNRLKLKENEKKEAFNLYLYEGHTVKGRVTDKNTGTPVEGARVSSISEFLSSQEDATGPDGFYMLKGLSGTDVTLIAQKENYILNGELHQRPFISVNLDPEILELSKDLQLIPGLFISGCVETEQSAPLKNAKVYLYQRNDWTTLEWAHPVDSNGKFKLMVQPFNICYVKATAEGYPIAFSDPIDVQNKPIDNIIVVLKKSSAISGFVRDNDNKPVQGAEIQAQFSLDMGNRTHYENLNAFVIISDSKGVFKAENLPPGNIVLTAEKDGYSKSKQKPIHLYPGKKETNVILQLTRSTFLAGKITDPEGNPVENIRIFVDTYVTGVRSYGNDSTDDKGRYRIEGLFNAPHKLTLRHAEYVDEQHKDVEVGREDADFVFNMKPKKRITLIGIVKDWKTGNPIENFNVTSRGWKPEKDPDVPGKFVIKNLYLEGGGMLKIESEGYITLNTGHFTLPENENPVEKTFTLGPGGIVKGRVVNKETHESLEGVGVLLFLTSNEYEISSISPAENLITRKDGLFSFESIPQGDIIIRFVPEPPLNPKLKSMSIKHGNITDMGDVEITNSGIIRGRLVQMPDEIPVPGKKISLKETSGAFPKVYITVTDEQGCFEFQNLISGRYYLQAQEYCIQELAEVKENETKEYTLKIGTGK